MDQGIREKMKAEMMEMMMEVMRNTLQKVTGEGERKEMERRPEEEEL